MREEVVLSVDTSGYLVDTRVVWSDRCHILSSSVNALNRSELIALLDVELALLLSSEEDLYSELLSIEVTDVENDLSIELLTDGK